MKLPSPLEGVIKASELKQVGSDGEGGVIKVRLIFIYSNNSIKTKISNLSDDPIHLSF